MQKLAHQSSSCLPTVCYATLTAQVRVMQLQVILQYSLADAFSQDFPQEVVGTADADFLNDFGDPLESTLREFANS